jgi:hypothetical protein
MFKLLLAAGAASFALAAPATAEPGKNKGNGNGQAKQGQMVQKSQTKQGQMVQKSEAKYAKNTRKVYDGHASGNYWGNRSCPPGLAKKNNGCLPPGIAKQSFNVGDRWNGNYGLWSTTRSRSIGELSTGSMRTIAITTATGISTASIRRLAWSRASFRRSSIRSACSCNQEEVARL